MRGLGAGRHAAPVAPGHGAAVAQRQHVRIAGFKPFVHFELAQLVQRQAQVGQQGGALDAGRPHAQPRGELAAVGGQHGIGAHFRDAAGRFHADAQLGQARGRGLRDLLGQGGQDARRALDQRDRQVALRAEIRQAVGADHVAGLDQLDRQLYAGGAAAHDHQVQPRGRIAHLGLIHQHHGLEHGQAELFGILGRVQRDRVFGRARRVEEVGGAAQRQHQRVVAQLAARQHFLSLRIGHRVHGDEPALPVHRDQSALREGKPFMWASIR